MSDTAVMLKTTLLAGAILLENGAEIKRVEDTMQRIATNAGYPAAQVFVLLTGITVSLPENATSEVRAIHNRGMDLEKVDQVNSLSRQFANHDIDLTEFPAALERDKQAVPTFPFSRLSLAADAVDGRLYWADNSCRLDYLWASRVGWFCCLLLDQSAGVNSVSQRIYGRFYYWSNYPTRLLSH